MQETWVQSLDQEDPLEEEMAAHSSILEWRIPWTEEPDRLHTVQRVPKSQIWLSTSLRQDSGERNQITGCLEPCKVLTWKRGTEIFY